MPAETLNCPMCGAPASTDAASCAHCGARLATVACPSCFGMMFIGEKFCSHCGARAAREEESAPARELCPRCKTEMEAVVIGKSHLRECPHCEGIWADTQTLDQICRDHDEQSAVLGMASHLPPEGTVELEKQIQYLPCPVCKELMNRVNFANCSHVVVDVCRAHGTWFDHDDLRHIVEFIQGGGMVKSREREVEDLEDRRRRAEFQSAGAGIASDFSSGTFSMGRNDVMWRIGIGAAGVLLRLLMK